MSARWAAAVLLVLCHRTLADHPCSNEVASACNERPAADIAACLKNPEEHDAPTEISSECTDFMALNKGCAEDIESSCGETGQFHDDTILCLTKWTPAENLKEQCGKVLKWAVPAAPAGEDSLITDELGMSDKDHAEKLEWQKKRREARGDAIERMKMKDVDKKVEEDRVSLEEYKKQDPEGYAQMIEQQEEEKRQQAAFKKNERARAAALERKKKADSGIEDEENKPKDDGSAGTGKAKKKPASWLYSIMSFVIIAGIGGLIYVFVSSPKTSGSAGNRKQSAGGKKKR